jgi:dihydrofolate synthase / folylpolyglutamate synthase
MLTYDRAINILGNLTNYERKSHELKPTFSLRGIQRLLGALGNPEREFPSVHVAGTVGKGSVCALLESALRAAGYRVGMYTSPHLWDVRERIRIDGRMISKKQFAQGVESVWDATGRDSDAATYFEAFTAIAFRAFADARVDIAIVEAGLGGRLDATNATPPFISVITRLGLDHTKVLGPTISHIAEEKAGIIKRGAIAVSAPQSSATMEVLRKRAHSLRASLIEVRPKNYCRITNETFEGIDIEVIVPEGITKPIRLPLSGAFQLENAAVALSTIASLGEKGFHIPRRALVRGFESVRWEGRLEAKKWGGRMILLDGAHNPTAARTVAHESALTKRSPVVLVFGIMRDKDLKNTLGPLAKQAECIVAVKLPGDRARSAEEIASVARNVCGKVHVASDMKRALDVAVKCAAREQVIVVAGSLYAVAEAGKIIDKK